MTTAPSGRALLITSDDEPATEIQRALNDAGFDVRRCVEDGSSGFPCNGLVSGACPLDVEGGVDVAVDVRQHPWPHPTRREAGVTCALRGGVPLVVVGHPHHPFEDYAAITTDREDVVATRCAQAIELSLEPMREAAASAVRSVLANRGVEAPFTVDVRRRQARLHVTITTGAPNDARRMAVTRAATAIRRFDPDATAIEIDVVDPA